MKKLLLGFLLISTIGGTTALASEIKMPELDRSMKINNEVIEDENAPWNIPSTYAESSFSFVNQKINVKTQLGHFSLSGTRNVNMGVVQTGSGETAKVAYQLYKTNVGSMESEYTLNGNLNPFYTSPRSLGSGSYHVNVTVKSPLKSGNGHMYSS